MEINIIPVFSAIWFGILTSVSPCPLATNILATSYIGKHIDSSYGTLIAGFFYTIGRATAYIAVSIIIIYSLLSIPEISFFLQDNMNKIIGPVLIIVGLFIMEIIPLNLKGFNLSRNIQERLSGGSVLGASLMGFVFALSFCPISAALFFGSVIPLALKYESKLLLPFLYGVGTALPVLLFAVIISYASRYAGTFINKLSVVEKWLRNITGILFVIIGIYFSLKYLFRLIS
ncbi:aromatic aminobenezylarsenical efflux permease ArsG family transporter [Desulfococcaceae bacterium HSG9]|nr:aromatic aminobenezylarsenical efflux permease ArsG family transporter [Desulfococcaceae bacterium HSG9]